MDLTTATVTSHTLTLTETELAELREAARCALDLGGQGDDHAATWQKLTRLGLGPARGLAEEYANPRLVGTERQGPDLH